MWTPPGQETLLGVSWFYSCDAGSLQRSQAALSLKTPRFTVATPGYRSPPPSSSSLLCPGPTTPSPPAASLTHSLTCSADVSKQNPHHPTPPSSRTGQLAWGIFEDCYHQEASDAVSLCMVRGRCNGSGSSSSLVFRLQQQQRAVRVCLRCRRGPVVETVMTSLSVCLLLLE